MPPTRFDELLNALASLDIDKFQEFEIISAQYKALQQGHSGISTDILIPKALIDNKSHAKCPILIRIHGGFLVTGSSRYAPWFSTWILDLAIKHQAIIVSPNYRLLPEADGEGILKDMDDFWDWLHNGGLEESISGANHTLLVPDLNRILMLGESAGAYLAIQLALSNPTQIRGVVAAYPMLDLKAPFYTECCQKPIIRVPNFASSVVDEHLARQGIHPPVYVTAADPPDRLDVAFAIIQNGRLLEFLGSKNPDLFPMERVQRLAASTEFSLPPFFIFHGEQDSAVPADGSRRFVSLLREKLPHVNVHLYLQEGDHGFDADATLETPWLRKGLSLVSENWITGTSQD